MRLINTHTYSLLEFVGDSIPPYAVLSHTWDEDQVTFQDMRTGSVTEKIGWLNMKSACRLAAQNGFQYLWTNTCCIDNSSSDELSEALNSMFRWFKRAGQCLVYLGDVSTKSSSSFTRSRWFTRGWTLTDLIAPAKVDFYSRDWEFIGSRSDLVNKISEVTGIDPFVLAGGDVKQVKVARRMFWASRRYTTRVEDQAYCLMGLFDVNMSLIYGEGERAFGRLQEEIYKFTDDPSIFAWNKDVDWQNLPAGTAVHGGAYFHVPQSGKYFQNSKRKRHIFYPFAKSPADFSHCGENFLPLGVEVIEESDDAFEDESLWGSMSTTSTLVQGSVDELANPALNHAIAFLNDDPELFPLFQAAMARPGVGVDRFRRILIGILRHLAVELALEAEDKDQQSSANFVRRYRLVIGSAVTASVAEKTLKPIELEHSHLEEQPGGVDGKEDEILNQDWEDSEDEEVENKAEDHFEVNVQFHSKSAFIRSSKAFEKMVKRLTDLAYPSFRSRAIEFVEKLLRTKCCGSDDLEYWDMMRSRMHLVISELIYSKPDGLFIDGEDEISRFERFQLGLESLTGEEWNWWPLKRPRPKLGPGESRLGWTCSCGDARWEAVPEEFAQHLPLLARKFPLANSSALPVVPPPTWDPARATVSTGKGSTSKGPPILPDNGPSERTGNAHASLPSSAHQTASQWPVQARFIFLVTQFGRNTLDELPSLHLGTADFGSELRSAYLRRKGLWSSWLSPYGFSHCDFAQFEKYRRNAYAHRGYGLPDLRLRQYFYSPTSWEPPISPEEFKDIFQYVARRQRPRWAILPMHNTDNDDLATDTVNRIPQRFWNFDKRTNERENFWGIYVRERRSAFVTGLYIALSLAPFIGFCFLYSFGIITGDIQNATTPLALSLTALGIFLGSMIKQ
ncbi:heterokaryon incompatibility protein-domain-containing protein [Xylaria curta]|nr:heterokaryon incompatibility protein-domain-containing protein [Xylaria curta]